MGFRGSPVSVVGRIPAAIGAPAISNAAQVGKSFHNIRALGSGDVPMWSFLDGATGVAIGYLMVPPSFKAAGGRVLRLVVGSQSSGNAVLGVRTAPIDDGVTYDPIPFTAEGNQVGVIVAKKRTTVSFSLTPQLSPGQLLIVEVSRAGADGSDTLADDLDLFGAFLEIRL